MEENKNNQEQMEETMETPVPAAELTEEVPAVEMPQEEVPAAEIPQEEVPAEPAKKATPGKIALAIGAVVVLAAVLIALILSSNQKKAEDAAVETVATEAVVEATIPADGNPEDVTCKGSYSVSDEEIKATADTVVATIGEHTLTNSQLQVYYWMEVQNFLNT